MHVFQNESKFSAVALTFGVAVPVLYFGSQIAAAFFFPGYSFLSQSASQLGSDLAKYPAIFNAGAILTGISTLIAVYGFFRAFQRLNTNTILTGIILLALASSAFMHLWAGFFPMPDPRHGQNPFQFGAILLPLLFVVALWKQGRIVLNTYLIASIALLVTLMADIVPIDRQLYDGLFQRLLALAVFPPIGVCAYVLLGQIQANPEHMPPAS